MKVIDYQVSKMERGGMDIVTDFSAREGWNPGLYDADSFYATDPHGFFMGLLNNEPIASISAVSYGNGFGYIGLYIVKPEYRGRGYGLRAWKVAMTYLQGHNIGLDGVVAQQDNYKKSGFKEAYRHIRYQGKGSNESIPEAKGLRGIAEISFAMLVAYDAQMFPARRPQFLRSWLQQPESCCFGIVEDDILQGYMVARKCRQGYRIGPLFANDPKRADELFIKARHFVGPEQELFIDVPESNREAIYLVDRYQMQPVFETARMYTREAPAVPLHCIFGSTTLELG